MIIRRLLLSVLVVCLGMVTISCSGNIKETTTVAVTTQPQNREFAVIDLGEIPQNLITYLEKTPFQTSVQKLISKPLSEIVEEIRIDGAQVSLKLKLAVTRFGRTFAPTDVIANLQHFYALHPEQVRANLLQSSVESNVLTLQFDRPVDFVAAFYGLPMFPSSVLDGTDQDSLGQYYVSAFAPGELLVLKSEDQKELHFVHMDVDVAKVAFEEEKLDLFLLPRDYAVEHWASKLEKAQVTVVDADYIYMMGFGREIPYDQRRRIIAAVKREKYVDQYLEGAAKVVNYPFALKDSETSEVMAEEPVRLICSVGSEWSYYLCESLKRDLDNAGFVVQSNYTDFTTALNVGMSETSDYVYLFAWKRSNPERYAELLGAEFEGLELSEMEELYARTIPVYSVAIPEVKYLVSSKYSHLVDVLSLRNENEN